MNIQVPPKMYDPISEIDAPTNKNIIPTIRDFLDLLIIRFSRNEILR